MRHQKGMGIDPVTTSFIIAGFNTGLGLLLNRKTGMQKELASQAVDEAAVHFDRLVFEWQSRQDKTQALKQFYLGEVLKGMDQVKRYLLNPELGEAGQRGVMERFGTYDPITGQGVRGSTWDWWGYYWDPIKNTEIVGEEGVIQQTGVSTVGSGGLDPMLILIGGGLVLFLVMKGRK